MKPNNNINTSISVIKIRQMNEEELVRLRELPSLPPTGSDGQMLKQPFRIPTRNRKLPKRPTSGLPRMGEPVNE